ncbi:hypothetical protein JAO29_04270 [Edaphobacter sp. HDX4]|uniref:hypothetical protein n=1 Tax=Edaphobacter sp. HDX4 TaxID=2794064 RepID=UPI002FE5DB29
MLTFGLLLNQLSDHLNALIQQFQNAGLILEVNAGSQITNLIDATREAFKDSLNTAESDLTAAQQQAKSGISDLIDQLQTQVVENLTTKLQQIANTLPITNKIPQVTSFSGNVVAPNIAGDIIISIAGNFVYVGEDGYDAQLTLGDFTTPNKIKTTQSLTFQIPHDNFAPSPNSVSYVPFTVTIPYKVTHLGIFHSKETMTFNFVAIVLPPAPGYYILQTSALGDTRQEIPDSCTGLIWDSSDNDDDAVRGANMTDGYQCMTETVSYHFTREEGDQGSDWFDLGNASTATFVGWHFKTEHHGLGTSGKLTVNLNFRKYKNVQQMQTAVGPSTPLLWGDSKVITIDPSATWKITFNQFNGVSKDYSSSDRSNPYLSISSAGNQLTLKVIPQ